MIGRAGGYPRPTHSLPLTLGSSDSDIFRGARVMEGLREALAYRAVELQIDGGAAC